MTSHLRSFAFRLLISLAALALVIFSLRNKLLEALFIVCSEVNWAWFLLAAVTYFIAIAILSLRLLYIFRVQNIHVTFKESLYLSFVGLFFNLFLPSAVGGDVAKVYYAYKHSGKKIESTTSVLLDRLMGFAALILMAVAALALFHDQLNDAKINRLVYIFLGIMLFSVLFLGSKRFARNFKIFSFLIPSGKWKQKLSDVYHAIYQYKRHMDTLLFTIFLSFVGQSMFVLLHYWVVRSLGIDIGVLIFFLFVPLIAIVSMAPSVGGLGVREAGIIFFFKRFMPTERALALSLLLDMLIYGYSLGSGIVYAMRGGLKSRVIHEMEELEA